MKFEEMNDLNLSDWRNLEHIKTESLWVGNFETLRTKEFGSNSFHGRFIPEIPYQMMLRYTKKGEAVWDCFAGSGTTIDVGKFLGRKVYANDIKSVRPDIIEADSRIWRPPEKVQLIIMHPPYWNIIKFSDNDKDLSNAKSLSEFCNGFEEIVANVSECLCDERMLILVISDVYCKGEQIPLDFCCYSILIKYGYKLKGRIVKDFGETKGSAKTNARLKNLWRYRRLKLGLWELGLDFILVFQKSRSKFLKILRGD